MAGGEAARRIGQRHAAPAEQFGLDASGGGQDGGQLVVAEFGGGHPAEGAQLAEDAQRGLVVDVETGAGHEGNVVLSGQSYRPHVVGLDLEAVLSGDLAQPPQVGLAFQQHLRRQDDFLAAVGQVLGQAIPVGKAHLLAA